MTDTLHRPAPPVLSARRSWPGTEEQIPEMRRWLLDRLGGRDVPENATAELIVGELATNAIRHTHSGDLGGKYVVQFDRAGVWFWVAVIDQGADDTVPTARPLEEAEESGRGLAIVAKESIQWGHAKVPAGRRTWAKICQQVPR